MTEAPPRIPFNRPGLVGNELEYMRQAVEGGHTSTGGPFTARAAETLIEWQDAHDVLLTTSCTDALEMSAMLLDVKPGDTVIVPSFTFVTTALAFARAGARLIFADIEPTTLGIDPDHVASLMDDSVRAVVPVHYAGIGCDLDGLNEVLTTWPDVDVIEDNAQGLFGTYRGRPLGSFGRFSTISFHETKNFICGEGGALVINQERDVDRAHVLLDKGTNRRAFFNGDVDKYSWVDTGSSFGLSDILAAYLVGQLEQRDAVLAERKRVFDTYGSLLTDLAASGVLALPIVPADRDPSYHMFYVRLGSRVERDRVLDGLRSEYIFPTFHYVPLDSSIAGTRFSDRSTACPVSHHVHDTLLRLPFYSGLPEDDQERVVEAIGRYVS
jgi:dTDP-4-amino-4,6-dideoxygalactose transaminase